MSKCESSKISCQRPQVVKLYNIFCASDLSLNHKFFLSTSDWLLKSFILKCNQINWNHSFYSIWRWSNWENCSKDIWIFLSSRVDVPSCWERHSSWSSQSPLHSMDCSRDCHNSSWKKIKSSSTFGGKKSFIRPGSCVLSQKTVTWGQLFNKCNLDQSDPDLEILFFFFLLSGIR